MPGCFSSLDLTNKDLKAILRWLLFSRCYIPLLSVFLSYVGTFFFLRFHLFIFREMGREREREKNIDVRENHWSVASHMHPDQARTHNPGLYPNWESNWRLFCFAMGSQASHTGQGCYVGALKISMTYETQPSKYVMSNWNTLSDSTCALFMLLSLWWVVMYLSN